MKSIRLFCGVLLLLGVISLPAMAGSVSMQFIGLPTSNTYGGVASYPYNISVNGEPNQWMMCIGYIEHIEGGETWQANIVPANNWTLAERTAAYLYTWALQVPNNPIATADYNAAAWYAMEGVPALDAAASTYLNTATFYATYLGAPRGVMLYQPVSGTESGTLGTPQVFLGSTPEPGALALFGSGMIGLAGMLRRKFRG